MKFQPKNLNKTTKKPVGKFQQGGPMPAEDPGMAAGDPGMEGGAPAPEQGGGQDPLMQLAQAAMQALQTQDCNIAMQVCQGFVALLQQAQGGAPAGQAPEGEPVFRKGGVLVRRIKK